MNLRPWTHRALSLCFAALNVAIGFGADVDAKRAKDLFANPPREYSSVPLWVWNDMLSERQVRETMQDMAKQSVKQVLVHPRPGLMTPYLDKEWFGLWRVALDEAKKLDMNVWIYDENSYPSGFAGGWVPELMPESRGRSLAFREVKQGIPQWSETTLGVFQLADGTAREVTQTAKDGNALAKGDYLVAEMRRAGNSPWHGDRCYVDLLYPGVTEKFLEITLGAYQREIGRQFGKRVPGAFTDEPNIRPAGGLPWTADLPEQFKKRWGYDLINSLASLSRPVGDWRRIRHNYYSTLNDLFIERWAKPYGAACEKLGLEMTGHYWEHEWPNCRSVPDNMAMYAWEQRPAIDTLMNQYQENTHAQFGNVRAVRELSSIANQLGKKRTLCELYGAGGWDMRFEDMKRIADWLGVLGVNTFDQHLSYVTIRGARKRDHPQSFSYHEPWWESYHVSASYLSRLSAAICQGEQINRILVLEPTTTAWMYQGDDKKLGPIGDSFFDLLMNLESAQVEYDLGCEDVMMRHGSVLRQGGKVALKVGNRNYDVVVIPPNTENLDAASARLIQQFAEAGGILFACGEPPSHIDGKPLAQGAWLADRKNWNFAASADLPQALIKSANDRDTGEKIFSITRDAADRGKLFHMRRHLADGDLLLLVNTSIDSPSMGEIVSGASSIERWHLDDGTIAAYPCSARKVSARGKDTSAIATKFALPPSGSLLLFLSNTGSTSKAAPAEITTIINPLGNPTAKRQEPNVLTLDYVDVTAGGESRNGTYFYDANQFVWKKNGMARNPWDSAVQYKDELITKKFPAESGFEATYQFVIEDSVPADLSIVIERPDLYTITCNGKRVSAKRGGWWLDKAFGRLAIAKAASKGTNRVTLKATPFTMFHELEPAYVLGDFSLRSAHKGFTIKAAHPLTIQPVEAGGSPVTHGINPDGAMWLSGGIDFEKRPDDRAPFVIFDLGSLHDISAIKIWNYNEANIRDLTSRGAESIRISTSSEAAPASFSVSTGSVHLKRAKGTPTLPETFALAGSKIRYVRLDMLSNHDGVTFPPTGPLQDNGFVGLAEVQFLDKAGRKLEGVRVVKCSSELTKHQRMAIHLVDGSGLSDKSRFGWNEQGMPFYSAGVSYSETFTIAKAAGRYVVQAPSWYGSVARVVVNGKEAGHLVSPPWQCDVTRFIKRGKNEVELIVIGTLKNTLGPHHGNAAPGSAWPSMFQRGAAGGQPAGDRYSTIAYGLFAPFELHHVTAENTERADR